jgi:hypothetical protein
MGVTLRVEPARKESIDQLAYSVAAGTDTSSSCDNDSMRRTRRFRDFHEDERGLAAIDLLPR